MSDKRSTAADILIDTLIRWNVDGVFGMPGDGINGIVEALRVRQDQVRFVVARHEEAAAFMACADAKWTGRSARHVPAQEDLLRAAAVLNAGRKIAILAGQGTAHASEELARTAELLAAPIAKALLGKAVLPDDHPYVTGGVGYLGARPSQQAFAECDTL